MQKNNDNPGRFFTNIVKERDFMTARKFHSYMGSISLHKFLSQILQGFITSATSVTMGVTGTRMINLNVGYKRKKKCRIL